VLKLRNPWGKGEYNGEYSDGCEKWTNELKKEADFPLQRKRTIPLPGQSPYYEDGIFYIKIEEFVKYFESLYACHYQEEYILSSMTDYNDNRSFSCYQFNILESGEFYFGLSQPDEAQLAESHQYGKIPSKFY
jgi:calpain-15